MPGFEVVIDKLLRMAQYLDQIEANRPAEYAHYAYEKTDDRIVFAGLPKFVVMYRQYVSHIRRVIG